MVENNPNSTGLEYFNNSESSSTNVYYNPNIEKINEKEYISQICQENKQLKLSNVSIAEKLIELEKEIRISNLQLEEVK